MSIAIDAACTVSCAGILAGSGWHFLTTAKGLKGDVPFHFGLDGSPSLFVGPRWFFLYPCLVGFTASQVAVLRRAQQRAEDRVDPSSVAAAAVTTVVGAGVLLYAQVTAARVSAGAESRMQHMSLVLAAIAGSVAPALFFQFRASLKAKQDGRAARRH